MEARSELIDEEQAKKLGLTFEPPPRNTCQFCGRTLRSLGVVLWGSLRWVTAEGCTCTGVVEEKKKQQAEEELKRARQLREELVKSGIKKRYFDAKICNPESDLFLASFESSPGCGFYVYGKVGRGKTYIASALGIEFIRGGFDTLVTTCTTMLENIKATFDSNDATITVSNRYADCSVLVIDDIGKEIPSMWAVSMLFEIINKRYEDMKTTIFTSQYSIDELKVQLSKRGEKESAEAIVSRIAETCRVFHLTGPDLRRPYGDYGANMLRGTTRDVTAPHPRTKRGYVV